MSDDVKVMSNEEFFSHMFNYSKAGPLVHGIIVTSLMAHLKQVVSVPAVAGASGGFINPNEWHRLCGIVLKEFEEKYGKA